MTEEEWLGSDDDIRMLQFAADLISARKKRLVLCECARRMWSELVVDWWRDVVGIAENYADGTTTAALLSAARERVYQCTGIVSHWPREDYQDLLDRGIRPTEPRTMTTINFLLLLTCPDKSLRGVSTYQGYQHIRERVDNLPFLVRDIVGNPFRPLAFDPAWRTEQTIGIAGKMYDEREFAAMPILADALEEAGCDNADILTHCREPGVHVRGCWVVDLVLGKA